MVSFFLFFFFLLKQGLGGSDIFLVLDLWFILYKGFFFFFFNTLLFFYTYLFIFKLVVSWFFIVWLRMNLLRYRFDQVASYTWHELVILSLVFLVEILLFLIIF